MSEYSLDTGNFGNSALYAEQRKTRGWDDTELWNLDYTIARFVYPRLKRFIKLEPVSYPNDFESYEDWIECLHKMLKSFEYASNSDNMEDLKDSEEIQEGFELFGKYFQHLWD